MLRVVTVAHRHEQQTVALGFLRKLAHTVGRDREEFQRLAFPQQSCEVGFPASLFLVAQHRGDKDGKVFGRSTRKAQRKLCAFQRIPDDLVGRVRTQIHLAFPFLWAVRAGASR